MIAFVFYKYDNYRFENRNGQEDYVYINTDSFSCASPVGRKGGKQIIRYGRQCQATGHLLHEFMHILGILIEYGSKYYQ